jgi:N-acetylmuramic acid 6-phosphate etherase
MTLPEDRSGIATEQRNPRSRSLHRLDIAGCVQLIQQEDAAVLAAMHAGSAALIALLRAAEPGFVAGGRLIYCGAGTSGRLAVLDAAEAPPTFQTPPGRVVALIAGGDRSLRHASEGAEDDPHGAQVELAALGLTAHDTLIGVAAGGTTPYVLGALALAKALPEPPLTALLCCTPRQRPDHADHCIVLPTGPEVITGSTRMKAGTATKLALNCISTTLMVRLGKVYENLMVDVRATNAKLRDRAARIVQELTGCGRMECFALLERCHGQVKTAVVMHRCGLDAEEAARRLAQHDGRLDRILG